MAFLAACCFAIGLAPLIVTPLLDHAVAVAAPEMTASALSTSTHLASLAPLGVLGVVLLVLLVAIALIVRSRIRAEPPASAVTWDCGYAAPAPSMQYTSSSFAALSVHIFRWALLPKTEAPRIASLFERSASFHSHVPDTVLDRAITPALGAAARLMVWIRHLQQGRVQVYLIFVVVTLLVLLSRV
jgi:hydrogenase-4 component B